MNGNKQEEKSKIQQLFDGIDIYKQAIEEASDALAFTGMEPDGSSEPDASKHWNDPIRFFLRFDTSKSNAMNMMNVYSILEETRLTASCDSVIKAFLPHKTARPTAEKEAAL